MKIGFLSDTHGEHELVSVPQCDILIFGGDCTRNGSTQEFSKFLSWFERQPADYRIMVAGSCDQCFITKTPAFCNVLANYVKKRGNFYLDRNCCNVCGLMIWGSPYSQMWSKSGGWAYKVKRGKDTEDVFANIPPSVDIIISHAPPYGILDLDPITGANLGIEALHERILKTTAQYILSGQVHLGYGGKKDSERVYYNGCLCDEDNKIVKSPIIFNY